MLPTCFILGPWPIPTAQPAASLPICLRILPGGSISLLGSFHPDLAQSPLTLALLLPFPHSLASHHPLRLSRVTCFTFPFNPTPTPGSLLPEPSLATSSPRKAEGETVPLLLATITLMPVSTKGTEKSIISERSSLMVSEPMAMSARL